MPIELSRVTKRVAAGASVVLLLILLMLPQGAGSQASSLASQEKRREAETKGSVAGTLVPGANLSPEQVITIQLEALHHNDTPTKDSGIATAFAFASPGNREATGPLARFIELVKSSQYKAMLNYRSVERDAIINHEGVAHQRVSIIDAQGNRAVFVFIVSRQTDGACPNCWLTDGVVRVPEKPKDGLLAMNHTDAHRITRARGKRIFSMSNLMEAKS